ncbi:uncharacterized protein LOC130046504 [Ostrea edulis]|uniref:uncharacterized protein LOC130046504 n=1 Tax=Ostrea edulis TaxID=37623 RepID=UPI0024AFB46C|nr:uncharacterized protein LOC130046504 [Ostrea edulis]
MVRLILVSLCVMSVVCQTKEECAKWNSFKDMIWDELRIRKSEERISELSSMISSMRTQINHLQRSSKFRCETGRFSKYNSPPPKWPFAQRVVFKIPFQNAPTVTYGLYLLDVGSSSNTRVSSSTSSITKEGFQLVLRSWADTKLYGAGIMWMACGY